MTLKIRILLYLTFITKSNQICTWNLAVFIDLWLCLLTTKLSYSQLFKWGHSNVIRGNFPQILWQRFREFLCNLLRLTIPYEVHQWTENTYKKILWFQFANNWSVLTGLPYGQRMRKTMLCEMENLFAFCVLRVKVLPT